MPDTALPGRVTYEDYWQFPNDGKRYEIVDGKVYVTPASRTTRWFSQIFSSSNEARCHAGASKARRS